MKLLEGKLVKGPKLWASEVEVISGLLDSAGLLALANILIEAVQALGRFIMTQGIRGGMLAGTRMIQREQKFPTTRMKTDS
jgi:hypothetical protein